MSFLIKVVRNVTRYSTPKSVTISANLSQKHGKCFSVDSRLCIKMYMEHENRYAYDIMRNRGYAGDIETTKKITPLSNQRLQEILQEDWSKQPPSQIYEAFTKISAYCSENKICISHTMFDNFIDSLTSKINKATDAELTSIFYALNMWPETPSIRTRNLIEVWAALDDACLERVNSWSHDETLSFIALFYMLNVSKVSDFCWKGLVKLAAKSKGLSPEQVVQTLFFIGIQRKPPHDMHSLEIYISKNISQFSIDELAIMSMGFFKSKTPIRSPELVKDIIEKIIENSKNIHEVSLAALLKVIRYSMRIPLEDCVAKVYNLLDVLKHEVPRLSVMCNVHIALLGTSKLVLHEECLESVAEIVLQKLCDTRLKDLERLVLTYGTLNYLPKRQHDFVENVMDELRKPERQAEILSHGRAFACCVSYLGLLGKHPVDLISKVLSPEFLKQTYGKPFAYGKEVLVLNNTAEIFCNGQEMNRLEPKVVKLLANKFTDYVPSEEFKKQYNITERMMLDIFKVLREVRGGYDYIVGDHILSHHQRGDLILCNDHDGTPLPVSMDRFSGFGLVRRPPDDRKWIVLIVTGRNGTVNGTHTPTGPFQLKMKELQQLGYYSNLVLWSVYSKLESFQDKKDYLTKLIDGAKSGSND